MPTRGEEEPVFTVADLAAESDSVVISEPGVALDEAPLLASMPGGIGRLQVVGTTARLRIHDDDGTLMADHPVPIPVRPSRSTRQLVHWDGALHLVHALPGGDVHLHRLGPDAPVLVGSITLAARGGAVGPYVRDGRLRFVVGLAPLVVHELVDAGSGVEVGRWDTAPSLESLRPAVAGQVVPGGVLFVAAERRPNPVDDVVVHRFVHVDDERGAVRVSARFRVGPAFGGPVGGLVVRDDDLVLSHREADGAAWLTMASLPPILDGMGSLER